MAPADSVRDMLKKGIRLGLTLAIAAAIFSQIDPVLIAGLVERIDPVWLAAALGVVFAVRVLVAWRFQILLRTVEIESTLLETMRVVLLSNALGHLLPTGIGQDVIRGHHVVRSHGRAVDVSATIVLERLVGVGSMLAVALVAGCIWLEGPLRTGTIAAVSLAALALAGGCGLARVGSRSESSLSLRLPLPDRVRTALVDVARAVSDTARLKQIFVPVFAISIAVQLARCVVFWCLYAALGTPVALVHTFAFVPIVFLLTSIPLSIGGLGIREGALIVLVGQLGVTAEVNVAAGLGFQLLQFAAVLPGLAIYWLRGYAPMAPSVRSS